MKASVVIERMAARRKCMIKRRAGLLELKNRPDLRVLFHKLLIPKITLPKSTSAKPASSMANVTLISIKNQE